jgi:molybdenum cofactor guanylyltransferase
MSARADLTVAILAGGRSSRMGQDKATLVLEGKTLGERTTDLALALSDDVLVLGHGRGMPDALVRVPDAQEDAGPLGGFAALAIHGVRARVLVLPVDMPFLTAPLLASLVEALDASVDVATFDGSPLPCALRAEALARLPTHGALHAAFAELRARTLPNADPRALENINGIEDLQRASRARAFL